MLSEGVTSRTGYFAVDMLLCAWICKKIMFLLTTSGYSLKDLPNECSVFKTVSCELCYLPCLPQAFFLFFFFFKTHYLENTGLPSTKNYVVMWRSCRLNLLSEILNISLLVVVEIVSILHGISIHTTSGNTCACMFFCLSKNICNWSQIWVQMGLK